MLENISFKKVAQEDKTLASLRLISAEEPISRFAQLRKLALKQINDKKEKPQTFQNAQKLASTINYLFGSGEDSDVEIGCDQIVSLIVALDDLRLFRKQAFELWRRGLLEDDSQAFQADALPVIVKILSERHKLSEGQTLWLSFVYSCAPDWQSLVKDDGNERHLPLRQIISKVEKILSACPAPDVVQGKSGADQISLLIIAEIEKLSLVGPLRPALMVLVEGQSESILLPAFARLLELDLDELAVQVIASGGSQQVARRYLSYRDLVDIPVFCLLDADAAESAALIEDSLREDYDDELFVLASGELEDAFSYEFLMTVLAQQMRSQGHAINTDLSHARLEIPRHGKRKGALERLFRANGLGDFDKVEFAQIAAEMLKSKEEVPEELRDFLFLVANKRGKLDL